LQRSLKEFNEKQPKDDDDSSAPVGTILNKGAAKEE
jgi:hypothetical protein